MTSFRQNTPKVGEMKTSRALLLLAIVSHFLTVSLAVYSLAICVQILQQMLHHLSRAKQLESSLEDPLSRRAQQLYERNELKLVKTIAMSVTSLLLSLAAIWTAVAERALLLALSSALSLLLVVLALVLNALPVPLVVALALNSGASLALSLALRRQQTSASLRFEPEVVFKRNI